MFGWLKKPNGGDPTSIVSAELKSYIARCEGCSNNEMANVFILSDAAMKRMIASSYVDWDAFDLYNADGERKRALAEANIRQIVEAFQRRKDFQGAAGFIVWIMSLRALIYPENCLLGKIMWAHFLRSMHIAFEIIQEQENIGGDPYLIIDDPSSVLLVPEALIPAPEEIPHELATRISTAWATSTMGAQLGRVPIFSPFWEMRP